MTFEPRPKCRVDHIEKQHPTRIRRLLGGDSSGSAELAAARGPSPAGKRQMILTLAADEFADWLRRIAAVAKAAHHRQHRDGLHADDWADCIGHPCHELSVLLADMALGRLV